MEPHTSYVICTNPRSGSWLLAEGLESTGIAGCPREWFNDVTQEEERQRSGLPPFELATYGPYLAWIKKVGASANGIFGLKLMYYQFAELLDKLSTIPHFARTPPETILSAAFPNIKYLWLTRRDKVRQAVSYYRACQTDSWWQIGDKQPAKRPGTVAVPRFDADAIARFEQLLVRNDQSWERTFQLGGITPLVVTYEDLAVDYNGVILHILQWLELPDAITVPIPPTRLRKQADAASEEWVDRYLASNKRAGACGPDKDALATPIVTIPDDWKRWIGENKLLKSSDASIVEVLVRKGFPRAVAAAEVQHAASVPYLHAGEWNTQRLKKAESLLAGLRALAFLHPLGTTVERRSNVSRDEFLEKYYAGNRPVILQGLMTAWRAMALWRQEYLRDALGQEEVEVMAGRDADPAYEMNSEGHRRAVLFGQYLDMVYSGGVTNDFYLVANNAFFQRPAARELLKDIEVFPAYLDPSLTQSHTFFWFGPAGTVTPLHHDTSNIFMAQVLGRKRIKLIPSYELEFVYNDIGVHSRVDCDNPDYERWPKFRNATILEVVLEPGEVLFLPVGWWHHVRALAVSLTISFTGFLFPNRFEWQMPNIRK